MNKRVSTRNQSPETIPVPVPDQLTIRFVRMVPSEEVVYFARRCAHRCAISGPLTIAIEASGGAGPSAGANGGEPANAVYEVRIEQQGRPVVSERDPEILLAVRNAFDRLAISYVELPPAHLIAPANSTEQGPKYWC